MVFCSTSLSAKWLQVFFRENTSKHLQREYKTVYLHKYNLFSFENVVSGTYIKRQWLSYVSSASRVLVQPSFIHKQENEAKHVWKHSHIYTTQERHFCMFLYMVVLQRDSISQLSKHIEKEYCNCACPSTMRPNIILLANLHYCFLAPLNLWLQHMYQCSSCLSIPPSPHQH